VQRPKETRLNFTGIRPDLISFVADRNPAKQGKYMPGSRIPIVDESRLYEIRSDFTVMLPWNLTEEVMDQIAYIQNWHGRFVAVISNERLL
jgi:hypothetical protein